MQFSSLPHSDKRRGGGTGDGGGEQQADGELLSSNEVRTAIIQLSTGPKAVSTPSSTAWPSWRGDIVLGTVEQVEAQTESARFGGPGLEGIGRTGANFRWPNCRIPYTIDPLEERTGQPIAQAVADWLANPKPRR